MSSFDGTSGRVALTRRQVSGTKADTVYDGLREQLTTGIRPFGAVLSTAEIAEEFGVSRRPVMDAMMRLELAGFIEIIRQVGCRVVVPDRETVREHFVTAAVLEGAAARLAAANATPEELAELRTARDEGSAAVSADDRRAFELANKRLHATILDAAGNRRLTALAHGAWDLSDFYLQDRPASDLQLSQREHEAIVDAIERRDALAARELMEQHMTRFGEETPVPTTSE